jgi:hypothetical protein
LTKLAQAQAQLQSAKAQSQATIDAAGRASDAAAAAEAAKQDALEAADEATRKTSPDSVFISRKTQRLYLRQGFQPVFEGPIALRGADKPIGTYIFTALSYSDDSGEARWSLVSSIGTGTMPSPSRTARLVSARRTRRPPTLSGPWPRSTA